jgi:hypothetical protein
VPFRAGVGFRDLPLDAGGGDEITGPSPSAAMRPEVAIHSHPSVCATPIVFAEPAIRRVAAV